MHFQLSNIVTQLQRQFDNILAVYATNNKSFNEQIRAVHAAIAGSGNGSSNMLLFLQKAANPLSGFLNLSLSPDPGTELVKTATLVDTDGLVLIDKWASEDLGFLTIPAGLWIANIYAFCSLNADNYLQLNVYSRAVNGDETLLFTMTNTTAITWTDRPRLIANFSENEGTFTVNSTDKLVTRVYAYTASTTPVDIKIAVAGKSRRSHIIFPVPQLHNLLAGKQGGSTANGGEYYHLDATEKDAINSIPGKEPSSNKSNDPADVDDEDKFPVWAALKEWTTSVFIANLDKAANAFLLDFPYDNRYISYFEGKWFDTAVPTWDGEKFAGCVGAVILVPSDTYLVGLRPTFVRITLNVTYCPPTTLDVYLTNWAGEVSDGAFGTVGSGYGQEILGLGTNVLTIPLNVTQDIVDIHLYTAPINPGDQIIYDILDIQFYTPRHTLPIQSTDEIGIGLQKVVNAINDISSTLVLKTINNISLFGNGNLYAPNYVEMDIFTDEFTLDNTTIAYFDDALGLVLPSEGDSYFDVTVLAPMLWDMSGCRVSVYWQHDAPQSVVDTLLLDILAKGAANGNSSTTAYGTVGEIENQGGAIDVMYISVPTELFSIGGSNRSCLVNFRFRRNGSTDNLAANVFIKALKIIWDLGDD